MCARATVLLQGHCSPLRGAGKLSKRRFRRRLNTCQGTYESEPKSVDRLTGTDRIEWCACSARVCACLCLLGVAWRRRKAQRQTDSTGSQVHPHTKDREGAQESIELLWD
jgi:hypothetical protein